MLKKAVALTSLMGLFTSLFLVQGLASASTSSPDYLIWQDNLQNVRWDVSSLLGNEPVPLGGLQNEYLFIGSTEPFYGVEITMENGSSDGEFEFMYYPGGNGPFALPDEVSFDSLEGVVEATWDTDDMGDWRATFISDAPYGATETSLNVLQNVYGVLLSTEADSSNEQVLTASDIQLITTPPVTTTSTSSNGEALSHDGELTFSDVERGNAETVEIEFLVADGVLNGYGDGTFQPDRTISRAELMKVLVAGQGIEPSSGDYTANCFSDVDSGDWWEPYVCYAKDQEWVNGYSDGTFKPKDPVSRAEAAKMVVNGMAFQDPENVNYMLIAMYNDVEEDDWYAPFVEILRSSGVEDGSGSFSPSGDMTREMAASYIFRVRSLNETSEDYFNTDVREEFLEMYGLEDLVNLAYTSSSSSSSSTSTYENVNASFGSCSSMEVTVTNYSGFAVDLTGWTVEADSYGSSAEDSPFDGITLADNESITVTASGNYAYTDSNGVTTTGVSLRDDNNSLKDSGFCNN